jgi:hypothetical protein
MSRSTRTTISLPAELKARMDAVGEPVNWSAIACRAFEQKLAEITRRRGVKNVRDIVTRLRASKTRQSDEHYNRGFENGKKWAAEEAEAGELERLAAARDGVGYDWDRMFDPDTADHNAYGACEHLVFIMRPESDGVRQAAADFWEHVAGNDSETLRWDPDGYVRGFAAGALEIWDEVKAQL